MNPTLSIIVLTYNQEPFIAQTINSILMQKTNFNFEIVIGEDCSTDATLSIIKRYVEKDPNKFNLLPSIKNLGIQANFLRCLKACNGNYIAICEGDDYWIDENKLQLQVDFLKKNKDYGLIGTLKNDLIQSKNKFVTPTSNSANDIETFNFNDFLFKNQLTPVTILIRTKIIKNYINLYESERAFHIYDYSIFLYASLHTKVARLNIITAVYRVLNNSASNTTNLKNLWKIRKQFYKDVLYFLQKGNVTNSIKKKVLHKHAIDIYLLALKNKDVEYSKVFYSILKNNNDKRYLFIPIAIKISLFCRIIKILEIINIKLGYPFLINPSSINKQ